MNSRDVIVLKKIIQYSDEISKTISRCNLTQQTFAEDFVARNAIAMCILQIGELVNKLTDEFKTVNNKMPRHEIKAMRNVAAHNYGEIDIDILWETATEDIPMLKEYCQNFI